MENQEQSSRSDIWHDYINQNLIKRAIYIHPHVVTKAENILGAPPSVVRPIYLFGYISCLCRKHNFTAARIEFTAPAKRIGNDSRKAFVVTANM